MKAGEYKSVFFATISMALNLVLSISLLKLAPHLINVHQTRYGKRSIQFLQLTLKVADDHNNPIPGVENKTSNSLHRWLTR